MTVVMYNNCEFSCQNTTEYSSTLSGVGEIITSIQRYFWPVWKVCIAWRISPAHNFDTFYIFTIKLSKSLARNFQTSLLAEVSICAGNSKEKRPLPRSDTSSVHDRGRVKPVCKTSSETGLEKQIVCMLRAELRCNDIEPVAQNTTQKSISIAF